MASNFLVDSREREKERGVYVEIESWECTLRLALPFYEYFRYHFFVFFKFLLNISVSLFWNSRRPQRS
jgi:hypothetical protein